MNNTIKNLLALGLFATLFAQPTFAQQVQLTLLKVKSGEQLSLTKPRTVMVSQSYIVKVPYTENVKQSFTVEVPYKEMRSEKYTTEVPYTETVTDKDGKKTEVKKTRLEERVRRVPVESTRIETRTKIVPIERVRSEIRVREVPVIRPGTEKQTVVFPPADAKFTYVSGKEITMDQIKELTTDTTTILQLQPSENLSDLQRQILKPDLIVMKLPPEEKENSEE